MSSSSSIVVPFGLDVTDADHASQVRGLQLIAREVSELGARTKELRIPPVHKVEAYPFGYSLSVLPFSQYQHICQDRPSRTLWLETLGAGNELFNTDFQLSIQAMNYSLSQYHARFGASSDTESFVVVSASATTPLRRALMHGYPIKTETTRVMSHDFGPLSSFTPSREREQRTPLVIPTRTIFAYGEEADVHLFRQATIVHSALPHGPKGRSTYYGIRLDTAEMLPSNELWNAAAWTLGHRETKIVRPFRSRLTGKLFEVSEAPSLTVTMIFGRSRISPERSSAFGMSGTVAVHPLTFQPMSLIFYRFSNLLVESWRPWLGAARALGAEASSLGSIRHVADTPRLIRMVPPEDNLEPVVAQSTNRMGNQRLTPKLLRPQSRITIENTSQQPPDLDSKTAPDASYQWRWNGSDWDVRFQVPGKERIEVGRVKRCIGASHIYRILRHTPDGNGTIEARAIALNPPPEWRSTQSQSLGSGAKAAKRAPKAIAARFREIEQAYRELPEAHPSEPPSTTLERKELSAQLQTLLSANPDLGIERIPKVRDPDVALAETIMKSIRRVYKRYRQREKVVGPHMDLEFFPGLAAHFETAFSQYGGSIRYTGGIVRWNS